jgi:hypothetical protein
LQIDESDKSYFNERITFIPEEENLKIYDKINYYDEKYKLTSTYINNLLYIYKLYVSEYKLLKDYFMASIYLVMEKKDEFFLSENGQIIYFDNEFKQKFELELLDYFAFLMTLISDNKDESKTEETTVSDCSNVFNPKASIKPYNRDTILKQESCEIDWGEKKITKKDLKKRSDYILDKIKVANQELRDDLESQIVRGNFKKKENTIAFCLPADCETVLADVKKKLYKN